MASEVAVLAKNGMPETGYEDLFSEYERIVMESLVKAFGLDALSRDQHGGDVDTIHNVRQIGKDAEMTYKNKENEMRYNNRGEYNSAEYHQHEGYISKNREISQKRKEGILQDEYTGEAIPRNGRSDLDHVVSGKEIHDDPGRVLTEIDGADLANNTPDNLKVTNMHTNRSKKADSMEEYLQKHGDEYTEEQKDRMRKLDQKARKEIDAQLNRKYYTSSKFLTDTTTAAAKTGLQMGIRQVLGFVLVEVWAEIRNTLNKKKHSKAKEMLLSSVAAIKRGIKNAKRRYKKMIAEFMNGAFAGVLASITTTLCNIFFTTAKNVVRIIRQSYVYIVEALKTIFINPENLALGDCISATVKILSVGGSVILGTMVQEAVSKSGIAGFPVVGEIVPAFCGALASGIVSCSLLYFFERSEYVKRIVIFLNELDMVNAAKNFAIEAKRRADEVEAYALKVLDIDVDTFRTEVERIRDSICALDDVSSEEDLKNKMNNIYKELNIKKSWKGNLSNHMEDRNKQLVFE